MTSLYRCHNIQQNNTQDNTVLVQITSLCWSNDIQHNDNEHNDNEHNDNEHNDNEHNDSNIMLLDDQCHYVEYRL
jgi:hypothetical protein